MNGIVHTSLLAIYLNQKLFGESPSNSPGTSHENKSTDPICALKELRLLSIICPLVSADAYLARLSNVFLAAGTSKCPDLSLS